MKLRHVIFLVATIALPEFVSAQGFSAHVLPPRFEDAAKAGATYRNVIEIQNTSPGPVSFKVRTADWDLDEQHSIAFDYALAPDSCRPWVGLESREIKLGGNARKRFRFEVAVPESAPARQCRFAIMIEGEPQKTDTGMSVAGRIGVIVYLDVGPAAAQLRVAEARTGVVEGRELPLLRVVNDGNAHGRLQGFLDGRDGNRRRWTLAPGDQPILPGRERDIYLYPIGEPEEAASDAITWPLTLNGTLEWKDQRLPVDITVRR